LLSKLERGRLFPTLPTLLRIALVFSVGLDYFFAGPASSLSWRWFARGARAAA
jgi:transcriptional regulator with XRE-family HTH domain